MNDIGKNQGEESSIFAFTRLANGKYAITARVTPPKITQLVIPTEYQGSPVARIKYFGFPDLREVTFTSAIRVIDKGAFADCTKLTTVHYTGTKEGWLKIKDAFSEKVTVLITESFVNEEVTQEGASTDAPSAPEPEVTEEPPKKKKKTEAKSEFDEYKLVRFLLTLFLGFLGSFIINHTDLKPKGYTSRTFSYFIFSYLTFGIYPLVASINNFFFDPKKERNIGYKRDPDYDPNEDYDEFH